MSTPNFLPETSLRIHPLLALESAGVVQGEWGIGAGAGRPAHHVYRVMCRDCGDVTRAESGGTVNDAPLDQANLYAQRHLARHLQELASEIAKFSR